MQFLSPIAALIAAGIAVPLLVALYFLKLRRRQMLVPSTLLWRKAVHDLEVNAPFQRLRRNLLLLLQLLILAGLLLAFARPTMLDVARPGQQVVLLIDHSASMNATDVSGTRLDEAKRAALALIDELGDRSSGGAMVVSFAERPAVRQPATTDRSALRAAVRNVEPTDQSTNLEPALRLIESFAKQDEQQGLVVYLLSDGRIGERPDTLAVPGLDLRFMRVGSDSPRNVGFVAVSARRSLEQPQDVQIFARLSNDQPEPVQVNVTLRLDGQVMQAARVQLPAADPDGESGKQSVKFDVEAPGLAVATLSHDYDDHLAADNRGYLVVAPPQQLRVLLVTEGNRFLRRALESANVEAVEVMTPAEYEAAAAGAAAGQVPGQVAGAVMRVDGYDVVVLDRHAPAAMPRTPTLSFASELPIEGLALREGSPSAARTQVVLDWDRQHALMRHVAMDDVLLVEPGRLVLPEGARVLANAQSGPIMAELSSGNVRHVVASFDLMQTNWPMQISFPVFVSNVVQHLALGGVGEAGYSHRPGEVVSVPVEPGVEQVRYRGPVAVSGRVTGARADLQAFKRVGLYTAERGVSQPWNQLAANLADPVESDLRPAAQLGVGSTAVQADARPTEMQREVWRYFVWAALAVLMLEWVIYARRMHL